MHRNKNILVAAVAGLCLFALGLSGISAPVENEDSWLAPYKAAMLSGK